MLNISNNNNNKTKNKLLIVDDDPDIIITFKIALENNGYIVDSYTNPLEAASNFKASIYDFVLLDVIMPSMDGFELAEAISGYSKAKDVPIIFLSAVRCNSGNTADSCCMIAAEYKGKIFFIHYALHFAGESF